MSFGSKAVQWSALLLLAGCAAELDGAAQDSEVAPQSQALAQSKAPGPVAVLYGLYGQETALPLCSIPTGFFCGRTSPGPGIATWLCGMEIIKPGASFYVSALSNAHATWNTNPKTMTWTQGVLEQALYTECKNDGSVHDAVVAAPTGSGTVTLAAVEGTIHHPYEGFVRGTVTLSRSSLTPARDSDIELVLQVAGELDWEDVATRKVTSSTTPTAFVLEQELPPGSDVRFVVRVASFATPGGLTSRQYRVRDVRVFTQKCIPDQDQPGSCL